jgi:hypothetical protein
MDPDEHITSLQLMTKVVPQKTTCNSPVPHAQTSIRHVDVTALVEKG